MAFSGPLPITGQEAGENSWDWKPRRRRVSVLLSKGHPVEPNQTTGEGRGPEGEARSFQTTELANSVDVFQSLELSP